MGLGEISGNQVWRVRPLTALEQCVVVLAARGANLAVKLEGVGVGVRCLKRHMEKGRFDTSTEIGAETSLVFCLVRISKDPKGQGAPPH